MTTTEDGTHENANGAAAAAGQEPPLRASDVDRSSHTAPAGRLSRPRVVVAVAIALLLVVLLGSLVGELFDGGGGPGRDGVGRG